MSSIMLLIVGLVIKNYVPTEDVLPVQLRLIFTGMKSAGAGIIASRLVNSFGSRLQIQTQGLFKCLIILGTAIIYFYFRSTASI